MCVNFNGHLFTYFDDRVKMVIAGEDPRSEQRDAADCVSAVSRQE